MCEAMLEPISLLNICSLVGCVLLSNIGLSGDGVGRKLHFHD